MMKLILISRILQVVVIISIFLAFNISSKSISPLKVVIAGAGPAGLLTAYALSKLENIKRKKEIFVFESRGDPRTSETGPRSYSLGLNIRGQSALSYFDAKNKNKDIKLLDAIKKEGVESDSFFLHVGKNKFQIRKPSKTTTKNDNNNLIPPTILIPRNRLCSALIDCLPSNNDNHSIALSFNNKIISVDFNNKIVIFEDGSKQEYDLIIGSDGYKSPVRTAMLSENNSFKFDYNILPGKFKVMIQSPSPLLLESDAVHAMGSTTTDKKNDFNMFLIPSPGNKTCAILSWDSNSTIPKALSADSPNDIVKNEISTRFPLFGVPSDQAVEQLQQQQPSEAVTVRCNRYHDSKGSAVLIGDAAHSTGGTLGQGANSALLDVVVLSECLEKYPDDIGQAISEFSSKQVNEGLALWQLLQLPPRGNPLFAIFYQLTQLIRTFVGKLFPFLKSMIPPPTQTALSQSLTPFSTIVKQNQFWVKLATRKSKEIKYEPEDVFGL